MAGFVNLHKMAPIKNSFSHFHSAQNGGKSAYFHLVQELHIAMHYLYNHSMHGRSKKQKPAISCAYAHSLCVVEVKKTYIKKKNNKTINSKFFHSLWLGTQVCFMENLYYCKIICSQEKQITRKNTENLGFKLGLQISL
jgi:hypothetical protein